MSTTYKDVIIIKYESQEYWACLIKMSLSRFFILHVLHQHSLHGYEITKQVAGLTNGCCAPTDGSLYPVLKEFTDVGLVNLTKQVVSGRERKVYTLTDAGEKAYQVASQAWGEVAEYILEAIKKSNPK
ncbi:MAG: PadR family transcriptional regulator [Desulfotomaculaceae bacterium]|nr:PadR family transcriptional regulator [Desulfotomaculaceae bacterium]